MNLLWCSLATLLWRASADRAVLYVKHTEGSMEALLKELSVRSDPSKPEFLSWLSQAQVAAILQPHPDHLLAVSSLLARHGASNVTYVGSGDKIIAEFPSEVPATFLKAAEESNALDYISSLGPSPFYPFKLRSSRFSESAEKQQQQEQQEQPAADPQKCLSDINGVDGACLRTAYGLTGGATDRTHGQAFIVNQGYLALDLAAFELKNKLPSQAVVKDVGPNVGKAGDEASLDVQYIITTGQGVPTTFVYLDGSMANPFDNWLVWAAAEPDASLPKVHSLSVGAAENEVGDAIITRMNTEMAALGVRGVSIVFASGDSGYQPQQKFGAASPYVTSVGGVYNGDLRDGALQADSLTTGGFAASKQNKAGTWQTDAIAQFLATKGQRPAVIDKTQRSVPDVSAYDDEINIIQNGQETSLSGTSAACPMVAGMLASINDALASAGHKTTLGFVNPFLYANQAAFLDITKGNNRGIAAVVGYDPISGLGTFSPTTYQQLKDAALKLLDQRQQTGGAVV